MTDPNKATTKKATTKKATTKKAATNKVTTKKATTKVTAKKVTPNKATKGKTPTKSKATTKSETSKQQVATYTPSAKEVNSLSATKVSNTQASKRNSPQVTIYIDDVPYQVSKDNNLLAGVLSEKLNLPYFCWHPSMGSVGACRQCAVMQYQDENDKRGRLIMSCMTPVVEGMRIGLKDKESSAFREQVIAAMMTNHPHDCPVCAEGGECHLQDMTVMTGHTSREYKGDKRTYENQYLGELVGHEMNRCITCYRCVRFYKDYAGGTDFDVFGSSNHVYFGRQKDGALESEFSGNLVEVCPTGVFTNKLFSAHFSRKWDLQSAPSICANCAVGCNTSIGERYGSVRRVVNRFNPDINGYFLCDRGRYGIGFVNGEQRIKTTQGIGSRSQKALNSSAKISPSNLDVSKSLVHYRGEKFIGIGSARASLEANYYLKQLVGKENFSAGLTANGMAMAAQHQAILSTYAAPSLLAIEESDFVFIIGEDITQTAPRVALSVRQSLSHLRIEEAKKIGIHHWQDAAVRTIGGERLSPLFSINSVPTKLDEVSRQYLIISPDEITALVLSLTERLTTLVESGKPPKTSKIAKKKVAEQSLEDKLFDALIPALLAAKQPAIISGYSLQSSALLAAIQGLMEIISRDEFAVLKPQFSSAHLAILPHECNSVGVLSLLDEKTLSLEQVIDNLSSEQLVKEKGNNLIILEQELTGLDQEQINSLRQHAKTLIVLEHSQSRLSAVADIVMPVSAVSEGDGHYVNYQGVVQQFHQVHAPILPIQESWRWLDSIANAVYRSHFDADIYHKSLTELHQYFIELSKDKAHDDWPFTNVIHLSGKGVARQTHRNSGRTAQMANQNVHESKTTQHSNDEFTFSMEGLRAASSAQMPFTWAPGWNSNQSITQYQTQVGGELITAQSELKLAFKPNKKLLTLWSVKAKPSKKTKKSNEATLHFVPKTTWYQGDWQSSFVPEFLLLHKYNTITVSADDAKSLQLTAGQFVQLTFNSTNSQKSTHALLTVDEQLSSGYAFGDILDVKGQETILSVQVKASNDEAINAYFTQEEARITAAKASKRNILSQLKINDQYIPIRLVSGGLDDV